MVVHSALIERPLLRVTMIAREAPWITPPMVLSRATKIREASTGAPGEEAGLPATAIPSQLISHSQTGVGIQGPPSTPCHDIGAADDADIDREWNHRHASTIPRGKLAVEGMLHRARQTVADGVDRVWQVVMLLGEDLTYAPLYAAQDRSANLRENVGV